MSPDVGHLAVRSVGTASLMYVSAELTKRRAVDLLRVATAICRAS
jgi:hypothetical protein